MYPARVLIVEDHPLFRQGLYDAIAHEADVEVVGEAQDGIEALVKAKELRPNLVMMDICLPRCSGLEAVSAIKRELPDVKIIVLTIYDQDENLYEAIRRGAEGFLNKNVRAKGLIDAIREVMKGEPVGLTALPRHAAAMAQSHGKPMPCCSSSPFAQPQESGPTAADY